MRSEQMNRHHVTHVPTGARLLVAPKHRNVLVTTTIASLHERSQIICAYNRGTRLGLCPGCWEPWQTAQRTKLDKTKSCSFEPNETSRDLECQTSWQAPCLFGCEPI